MDRKCAICGKTHNLFTLELQDDNGDKYHRFVCGSCWEIIAAVALRAFEAKQIDNEDANIPEDFGTHQYHDIG